MVLRASPQMTRYLDPVLLWTVAATATSRIRLNASTLSTFYYEPVHLARLLTTLGVLSEGRQDVGVGIGWMKDEHDTARSADWHRRGRQLDDLLVFLHEWWTTTPVSWESEFFLLPPVHADLRPVQPGGPPIWIGGVSEAAMRRVGRSGTGWLGVEGLQDKVTDQLWSIARRAAKAAGRDPDELKTAVRVNLEPGTSLDSLSTGSNASLGPVPTRRSWMPSQCSPPWTRRLISPVRSSVDGIDRDARR
ncbi:LLM class flavin-dependent oxidoreductase [Mycolicibacterium septicum]|nr:LLM class flavin-dependent oxidoreductase [Mycolicibacterium septicum]